MSRLHAGARKELVIVSNRPAQALTDQDAIQAHLALVEHGRKVAEPSQAEHTAQCRTGRVRSGIGLGRSDCGWPVLVAGDWIRARAARLSAAVVSGRPR